MVEGMKPSVFYNSDPTYEKATTNIKRESQKTEAEVKNFFEEIRKCRHIIDSLNQCKIQYEMDMISLKATRYDKDRVSGGRTSDLSDMVIAFEEKMKASEELRYSASAGERAYRRARSAGDGAAAWRRFHSR